MALRRATESTPIVAVAGSDPVAEGWARSLAQPGGNVTGLAVTFPELGPKRLELAKQALPGISRVAVLLAPSEMPRDGADEIATMSAAARSLDLQMQVLKVRDPDDFEPAIHLARQERVEAIVAFDTTLVATNRPLIERAVLRARLPVIGEFPFFGGQGVLMTYGADLDDLLRRAASYVDRILKGARAGDLPVERPSKLSLVINNRMARELGIVVPPSLRSRADRLIE